MLRKLQQLVICRMPPSQIVELRQQLSSSAAVPVSSAKEKWDLHAGVLVERLPVITKTLTQLEQQFQDLLWRIEFENSFKSNYEVQHERELVQAELIKSGKAEVDLDEGVVKQTAQDFKDSYVDELRKFKVAPRITKDDESNNKASINRCLQDNLYLLVEQQLGVKSYFILPQGQRQDGETMRQAAERVLNEQCGTQMQVKFYGNAPCGFYKYKYPKTAQTETVGAKVFFYRAVLEKGNVDKKAAKNFEWLSKSALEQKLNNTTYAKSVTKFLI